MDAKQYKEVLADAPAFTYGQRDALRNFIKKSIITGDNEDTLVKIEHGKIRPSKQLQDSISGMLKGNKEFIMLDEQKVVYENILSLSTKCQKDGKKRTIIVEGGPGTGKTVVAINLLAELTKRNQFVQYVSKNAAPRTVYGYKLKGTMKKSSVDNLFKGSGCYTEAPMNSVGTILADEAHRLNEKSGMFQNMGENQIKEIIHASRCSVFFIDESQRVTTSDIGSIAEIEKWAEREIELLKEANKPDEGECFDYVGGCCDSALKAFEVLLDDEHSGLSIQITKMILDKLIDGKALTPIEDVPEAWNFIGCFNEEEEAAGIKRYQCKRMSSLSVSYTHLTLPTILRV